MEELEEEHSGEEGLLADAKNEKDRITKANVQKRLREVNADSGQLAVDNKEEIAVLQDYLNLADQEVEANKKIKAAQDAVEQKVLAKYKALTEDEIKILVVEAKWMAALEKDVKTEMERISQRLTGRIKELAERYAVPLPSLALEVNELEQEVQAHLNKMGFAWK